MYMQNETLFNRTMPLRLWCTILNNWYHMCVDKHNNGPLLHGIMAQILQYGSLKYPFGGNACPG